MIGATFREMERCRILKFNKIDNRTIYYYFINLPTFGLFYNYRDGGILFFSGYFTPDVISNYSQNDSTAEVLIKVDPRIIYYLEIFNPSYRVGDY